MSFKLENIALKNVSLVNKTISAFCFLTISDLPIGIRGIGCGSRNNAIIEFDNITSQENFQFVSELPYILSSNFSGNYLVKWSFSCYLEEDRFPSPITACISTLANPDLQFPFLYTPDSTSELTSVSFSCIVKLEGLNDGFIFSFKSLPNTGSRSYMYLDSCIVTLHRI